MVTALLLFMLAVFAFLELAAIKGNLGHVMDALAAPSKQ